MAESKMLRFSMGVTRIDKIRNEYMRGIARVDGIKNNWRETRLKWYGYILRRKNSYVKKGRLQ